MPVRIVTDSTCDLPLSLARDLGITIVPVYVRFGQHSYRDGVDISREEFYQRLPASPVHPTTSQPTPADFAEAYRKLAADTDGIVSVHVSGKLSGTCNSALQGKDMAGAGRDIRIVDSHSVTMGLGMITLVAARLAAAGANLEQVTAAVGHAIGSTRLLGIFDTLRYLQLGGRIGKARALLGSVLSVKPVLTLRDGELRPSGSARTRASGIARLTDFVRSATGVEEVAAIHSTTPDEARSLLERISLRLSSDRLHLARLGPALGTHGGPGVLAVALRTGAIGADQSPRGAGAESRRIRLPSLRRPGRRQTAEEG
jgi:DegV family protein with EDD domain